MEVREKPVVRHRPGSQCFVAWLDDWCGQGPRSRASAIKAGENQLVDSGAARVEEETGTLRELERELRSFLAGETDRFGNEPSSGDYMSKETTEAFLRAVEELLLGNGCANTDAPARVAFFVERSATRCGGTSVYSIRIGARDDVGRWHWRGIEFRLFEFAGSRFAEVVGGRSAARRGGSAGPRIRDLVAFALRWFKEMEECGFFADGWPFPEWSLEEHEGRD
jgi:hypothetical protein